MLHSSRDRSTGNMSSFNNLDRFIERTVRENRTDRPVYVVSLDDVIEKFHQWNRMLPNIKPFYAVKCCETPGIVSLLAKLGVAFDCASESEINLILREGVSPSDIIFANPCKNNDMISHARIHEVKMMTFDSELELVKISKLYPDAQLVIRLRVDDTSSKYKLGFKFGMDVADVEPILEKAIELKMNVIGVAFHVGSDSKNPDSFRSALEMSREVFDIAARMGFEFSLLDLGGGFPGDIDFTDDNNLFYQMVDVIRKSLEKSFPQTKFPDLQIIAEPGRYFVSSALTLLVKVIGKRSCVQNGNTCMMYYLNDGLFGSFLLKFWEPELVKTLRPYLSETEMSNRKKFRSILFGPTCDSTDVVLEDDAFPELFPGDHLIVYNYGAYSVPLTTPFNGILPPFYQYFTSGDCLNGKLENNDLTMVNGHPTMNGYSAINEHLLINGHSRLPN